MGTKASIAEQWNDGWRGYYVHSDGGPNVTGLALVKMIRERGAVATFACAAQAPQGWSHFPDEPAVHHDDPFILDGDDELKVYRGEDWGDSGCRRFIRVATIDPRAPDAVPTMFALDLRRDEVASEDPAYVDLNQHLRLLPPVP